MELMGRQGAPVEAVLLPASSSRPMWPRPAHAPCSQSASSLTAIAVWSLAQAVLFVLSFLIHGYLIRLINPGVSSATVSAPSGKHLVTLTVVKDLIREALAEDQRSRECPPESGMFVISCMVPHLVLGSPHCGFIAYLS